MAMSGMAGGSVQEQNTARIKGAVTNDYHTRNATHILSLGAHYSYVLTVLQEDLGKHHHPYVRRKYWHMWMRAVANHRVTPASARYLMQPSILQSCYLALRVAFT